MQAHGSPYGSSGLGAATALPRSGSRSNCCASRASWNRWSSRWCGRPTSSSWATKRWPACRWSRAGRRIGGWPGPSSSGSARDLEVACLAAAADLGPVPEDRLLFVNLSPSLLADPGALDALDDLPDRLVVELTEQEAVSDYCRLRHDLEPWLARGVRVAIDDTGAGYSSLRHVIELTPDFLKLDRELVRDLGTDKNRRALVSAMVAFASEVGTSVIAEGVETETELDILCDGRGASGAGLSPGPTRSGLADPRLCWADRQGIRPAR